MANPVAEDLARQSAFYAAHDRTQDARPECDPCEEEGREFDPALHDGVECWAGQEARHV